MSKITTGELYELTLRCRTMMREHREITGYYRMPNFGWLHAIQNHPDLTIVGLLEELWSYRIALKVAGSDLDSVQLVVQLNDSITQLKNRVETLEGALHGISIQTDLMAKAIEEGRLEKKVDLYLRDIRKELVVYQEAPDHD